jgi:hypothetical protein
LKAEEKIKILSRDANYQEIIQTVGTRRFKKKFKKLMSIFEQSTLNALEGTKKSNSSWKIRSIEVGPSIGTSLGLGSFWEIGGYAGFKLLFEKK